MLMTKSEIEKFINRKQKVYDRNFRNFQETGDPHYDYAAHQAENLIDLARQALNAADDHQMAGVYRSEVAEWGNRALEITRDLKYWDETKALQLLKDIASVAKSRGLIWDRWQS